MSDSATGGFGKFVPGFDFLQNLAKGSNTALPGLSNWVAPTMEPKEIDKRIEELKAVLFWLDQNATALKATIQALELQKMTLATLKGMNLDMSSMAQAFKFPGLIPPMNPSTPAPPEPVAEVAPSPFAPAAAPAKPKTSRQKSTPKAVSGKTTPAVVDPMQLWGALTQQFQEIAAGAMKEVSNQAARATGLVANPPATKSSTKTTAKAKPAAKVTKAAKGLAPRRR